MEPSPVRLVPDEPRALGSERANAEESGEDVTKASFKKGSRRGGDVKSTDANTESEGTSQETSPKGTEVD